MFLDSGTLDLGTVEPGGLGRGDLGPGGLGGLVGELHLPSLALSLAGESHLLALHIHPLALTLVGLHILAGLGQVRHLPLALEQSALHLLTRLPVPSDL